VHNLDPIWLVFAGFGGGLAGSIAGLASLVSYPALLAIGLAPVTANVTNTVALVFNSTGSIWGSRPELSDRRGHIKVLVPTAIAGGITGGLLLLAMPSKSFTLVVPVLIGVASLGVLIRRNPANLIVASPHAPGWVLTIWVYFIGVYGGYFGAAAGVLMLAVLLYSTGESIARANAMKNLLLGGANGIAAIAFIVFGSVRWSAAIPLALGFLAGGRLGPIIVRRAPTQPLRYLIACAGLGLAVHLGLDAY
jgi:uncharacterized membrane protein YfcA